MTDVEDYALDRRALRRNFERAAAGYDQAAVLQHEIARRMLERLEYIRVDPRRVLDAGAGTGQGTAGLLKAYPRSTVVGLDLSVAMLQRARRQGRLWRRPAVVCGDAEQLPLAEASVDLLFSNLTLQWCNDLDRTFSEFRRVLATDGLLMFSSFGPDTLSELRAAWSEVDGFTHVSSFTDMHDVGDALVRAGFADPVMDMEVVTMTYPDLHQLMAELKAIGAANVTRGRRHGLTGRRRLEALAAAYEPFRRAEDGRLPVTYEVVYGHAWVPDAPPPSRPASGRGFIPLRPA